MRVKALAPKHTVRLSVVSRKLLKEKGYVCEVSTTSHALSKLGSRELLLHFMVLLEGLLFTVFKTVFKFAHL